MTGGRTWTRQVFPLFSVPVALAALVAITRLVIRAPLRRASRMKDVQAGRRGPAWTS